MDPWLIFLAGLVTVAGSVLGARYASRASVKVKELDVAGQAYVQAQGINADIVRALQGRITDLEGDRKKDKAEHEAELAKRDVRLDALEREFREVRDHNNALITFAYKLIALARKHGYEGEIPTPAPRGIHI